MSDVFRSFCCYSNKEVCRLLACLLGAETSTLQTVIVLRVPRALFNRNNTLQADVVATAWC